MVLLHTTRHCAHIWIARQNYKPRPNNLYSYSPWPWLPCVFSSPCSCAFRLCRWTLCSTCELCNYSWAISSRLQHDGLQPTKSRLVSLTVTIAGFSIFLICHWSWLCLWTGWALCFLISLCGIVWVEQICGSTWVREPCRWDRLIACGAGRRND